MRIRQRQAFIEFSNTFEPGVVREWEAMVTAWEHDPKRPDPYEEPQTGTPLSFSRFYY